MSSFRIYINSATGFTKNGVIRFRIILNKISRSTLFDWFKEFKLNNECRQAKKPPGRPSRSIEQLPDIQKCM